MALGQYLYFYCNNNKKDSFKYEYKYALHLLEYRIIVFLVLCLIIFHDFSFRKSLSNFKET